MGTRTTVIPIGTVGGIAVPTFMSTTTRMSGITPMFPTTVTAMEIPGGPASAGQFASRISALLALAHVPIQA